MRCWSAAGVRPPRPQANQVFQGLDLPPSPERALTAPPKGSSQQPLDIVAVLLSQNGGPALRGSPPAGGRGLNADMTVGDRAGHAENWGSHPPEDTGEARAQGR